MTISLQGVGVARGIAIGKVHILERDQQDITEYHLDQSIIQQEVARFRIAVSLARQQLRSVRNNIPLNTPGDITAFIETHLLMLDDPALTKEPLNIIKEKHCNAEWALKLQRDALVSVFDEMEDEYLRTRKDDVDHVVDRLMRILLDQGPVSHEAGGSHLEGYIVLADDLAPSDTVLMQHQGITAFVTEHGGPTSHTAILARSLGIPSIVALYRALRYIHEDDLLIIDANDGVVLINPDETIVAHYQQRQKDYHQYQTKLIQLKEKPAVTEDSVEISLLANIELQQDYSTVRSVGAKGVGLYRTEYLYMNRETPPDEEEHYQMYTTVMRILNNIPVTLRTLDLGGDKSADGVNTSLPLSSNPALGLRAIRLCLKQPRLFEPQLRAILRASAVGPLRMMIPMLSNIQEIREVLFIMANIRKEFDEKGIPYNPDLKIGGMIETPAAAICADHFAQYLDFISIGTNDLIQYSIAIDRVNEEVNYLYDPLHPGVLRLIYMAIKAGHDHDIPVAMCGEMAGDPRFTRLLLGMGLREFSVHPASLLEIKKIIHTSNTSQLISKTLEIFNAIDSVEANEILDSLNE